MPSDSCCGDSGRPHPPRSAIPVGRVPRGILPTVTSRYDAIVVDEAQDFTASWWHTVDELLFEGAEGTLYVFFDQNQNLLSFCKKIQNNRCLWYHFGAKLVTKTPRIDVEKDHDSYTFLTCVFVEAK